MRTDYKWIRLRNDIYFELSEIGQFNESFSDILRKLLDRYYVRQQEGSPKHEGPAAVGRDEVKARLKKFDSQTKAISKLVRENISYSTTE